MRSSTVLCLTLVLLAAGLSGCYHGAGDGSSDEGSGGGGGGAGYATGDRAVAPLAPPTPPADAPRPS